MRLRKPCEHIDEMHPYGHYVEHELDFIWAGKSWPDFAMCPGGDFLPEGALPSREALAEAFHAMQHDEATGRPAVLVGWDAVVVTQALEWVLDALASQVGESER